MFEERKFRNQAVEDVARLAAAPAADRVRALLEKGAELMGLGRADWGAEEAVLSAVLPGLRAAGGIPEKDLARIEGEIRELRGQGRALDADPNWNRGTSGARSRIQGHFLALRNPPEPAPPPDNEEERFLRSRREALDGSLAGAPPAGAGRLLLEAAASAVGEDPPHWGAERLLQEILPRLRALPGFDGARLKAAERLLTDLAPTPGSFPADDPGWRSGTRRLRAKLRAKLEEL